MANEDYRIQAYKRVAGMGEGETPVDAPQDSFTPNVAADLVRASMNSPNSIRGTVNGVPVGTGISVSLGAGNSVGQGHDVVDVENAKGKEKKKATVVMLSTSGICLLCRPGIDFQQSYCRRSFEGDPR